MIALIKSLSCVKEFLNNFKVKKQKFMHWFQADKNVEIQDQKFDILNNYGYNISKKMDECLDFDGNPIPWYTYPSIEYLNQFDYSQKRIFEYGCGNSSLFWAQRAKEVISVDNNKDWHEKIHKKKPKNLRVLLEENLDSYAECIENYGKFDIIIIDGYNRNKCGEYALKHLNDGGFIVFDNSDRCPDFEEYEQTAKILRENDLLQVDFYGFGPLNNYTWCTSMFFTKNFDIKTKSKYQPVRGINSVIER